MDIHEQFTRVKFAVVVLGTNMLQCIFVNLKDNFLVAAKLRQKLNTKEFNPLFMDFMKLYNFCTMNVVDHVRPSEDWGNSFIRPQDTSLGDDIKRLKWLYDELSTMDSDMLAFKECNTSVCKMITEIINRFSTSENVDFTKCFQSIMSENDIEHMEEDIQHVMNGDARMMDILKRYRDDTYRSNTKFSTTVKLPRSYNRRHQDEDTSAASAKCLSSTGASRILRTSTRRTATVDRQEHSLGNIGLDKCPSESFTEENKRNTIQRGWSSSSSNTREKEFVCSQIYFDFVPPQLNHFEYTMKELACIEKSINRILGPLGFPWSSTVSQYLSFTFIHGNHMDLKQASLNLFNAVPAKTEKEENKSGIIVLFLDRDITFITLKEMTDCTLKHGDKKGKMFAAVQSDELLKDRTQLRSILKPYFRSGCKVIDVNAGLQKLYNEFDEVAKEVGAIVKSLLSEAKTSCISNGRLMSIEQRFSKLKRAEKSNDRPGKAQGKRLTLLSLKDKGLRGYTFQNNTLHLYFQDHVTEDVIPQRIRAEFPNLKIIHLDHPIFTCHHIKAGDKLHPFQSNARRYGTIGMFCDVYNRVKKSKERCCISSAHVISLDQTAYISDGNIELGLCVWPPSPRNNCVNVEDFSVVEIRKKCNFLTEPNPRERVTLFGRDISVLNKRKVYKFGASTQKTIGYVSDTNFVLIMGSEINVFLIEPEDEGDDEGDDESRFSKPGDSGAVVLTKFGEAVEAFSMIFGGVEDIPGLPANNSIAVDLKKAINNFEVSQNKMIEPESLHL